MTNKYLEKVSGVASVVGRFAKNLTGETVRETKRAANLHKGMKSVHETAGHDHFKHMDNFTSNHSSKDPNVLKSWHAAKDTHRHQTAGMHKMKNEASKHVPHKSDADVESAVKEMNKTRAITGGLAVSGVVGYSGAKNREKRAEMNNKYLEKIAGFPMGVLGKRIAIGAAVGGASGAALGGKDNRIKGALAGAAAGGVAGSVFGKAVQAKKMKNIVPAGSKLGAGAKLINPKAIA